MKIEILNKQESFASKFAYCCQNYNHLEIAVAWCGDPAKTLPYEHLESFRGKIMATIGTAFSQTHPDAIQWLKDQNVDIRIFRDDGHLFHPKVYLFTKGNHYSLFIGSSNFTYNGFFTNIETNILVEGKLSGNGSADIDELQAQIAKWRSNRFSFKPNASWLKKYRKEHLIAIKKARKYGLQTESRMEKELGNASWLRYADWNIYYAKVIKGLYQLKNKFEMEDSGFNHCKSVLDDSARLLTVPWKESYFSDIEKRRVINGIGNYGWLGHVGASGPFLHLVANGTSNQHRIIIRCINTISSMDPPIPWERFGSALHELLSLGPTMKVWGRLLSLTRPDLFCTVASISVRTNLSKTLKVPRQRFVGVDGYVKLIKLIHASPWFNSHKPKNDQEISIWKRRVAYMDAIFY